jgi:hypothetical protein
MGDRAGPPPVLNKRFEKLADEEREKYKDREDRRGPPPLVTNSRFAAAADADRSNFRDDRGPPPVTNSRFAAAADADRSSNFRDDRGPPPIANSRFAAAAAADRSNRDEDFSRDQRGPPPQVNSRFARAAAMAEEEDGGRRGRDEPFGRNDGPPMPQNSRFAAAAAADSDYVERGDRDRDRDRQDDRGGSRFGGRDDYERRGGRNDYDRQDRGGNDRGFGGRDDRGYGDRQQGPPKSAVSNLLKPKARPMEDNILKVPTKQHHDDNVLKAPSKAEKKEDKVENKPAPAAVDVVKAVDDTEVIAEFISGKRLGEELKSWCADQIIPNVEKLVFTFLQENQKLNPDVECAWAEPTKYGAALVSLVEDDLLKQVDVLFGIQKYCDKLGMPKLNEEYVVQSMFRAMYKYDLASDDAFAMWKEDESDEHMTGKLNAVIQTVDWFNWLEEEDDEEEDDEE